jgi:hypothetical protein
LDISSDLPELIQLRAKLDQRWNKGRTRKMVVSQMLGQIVMAHPDRLPESMYQGKFTIWSQTLGQRKDAFGFGKMIQTREFRRLFLDPAGRQKASNRVQGLR